MTERDHRQQIVDEAVEKVMDKPGVTAEEGRVRDLAREAVDELIDQPVQTFTPLLAENEVLTELHADGKAASQAHVAPTD
ncbi:hypothetical protein KLP28_06700 [Nocardioidaceae bacterium]|nr:hypothetical protein KLP28_06700 [Nocardioidaceae bacterium]